ncbi:hypothetical protein N7449_009653 [Penicillium cf. viridicatum]|uniref:Uncharacterized protein n=1 Tax=Penicillium cf. viridicatum TaxID=2972119 RepID=A0A9W9M889_9EURO|nr:hypothetical protein N7449_009653 [Penicillium cf. viridicatum]
MKAVIYHGLEGEDSSTLCRGALLIILRLISSQLSKVRLLHHKILTVSFMGNNVRLLESYFEGESLVLRSSYLCELSEQTTTSMVFKGFAEWFLGDPEGGTLYGSCFFGSGRCWMGYKLVFGYGRLGFDSFSAGFSRY